VCWNTRTCGVYRTTRKNAKCLCDLQLSSQTAITAERPSSSTNTPKRHHAYGMTVAIISLSSSPLPCIFLSPLFDFGEEVRQDCTFFLVADTLY
jgi:hypothetical protein